MTRSGAVASARDNPAPPSRATSTVCPSTSRLFRRPKARSSLSSMTRMRLMSPQGCPFAPRTPRRPRRAWTLAPAARRPHACRRGRSSRPRRGRRAGVPAPAPPRARSRYRRFRNDGPAPGERTVSRRDRDPWRGCSKSSKAIVMPIISTRVSILDAS